MLPQAVCLNPGPLLMALFGGGLGGAALSEEVCH